MIRAILAAIAACVGLGLIAIAAVLWAFCPKNRTRNEADDE